MFISTSLRANISISKREFSKSVLKKRFHEFFLHHSILFSHTYLSYALLYQSSRDLCCESIWGDQSVEITKVFSFLYLRRRTWGFAVFRVLVRAHCRGAVSTSLRAWGVLFLREQVRGLVSPRVLVWTPCRCCDTEWSGGIVLKWKSFIVLKTGT